MGGQVRRVRGFDKKAGCAVAMRVEAFFCLDFFVTFFIKKKSKATGSYKFPI